jgi:hypothetical protein
MKDEAVDVRVGWKHHIELCDKCGSHILRFLMKHKLIKPDKEK